MLNLDFYYIRRGVFLRNLVIMLAVTLFGTSCSQVNDGLVRGRKAVESVMDSAEKKMDNAPLVADSLMKLIDAQSIRSKEMKARYALLYTEAEYKSFQTATSDSLIMTAVRFYSISNNLNYRFLSNYYLGCVYLDLGQYTKAAAAFSNAEQLSNFIDNDYWKGLLYEQLGRIFFETCDYNRSQDYYVKAESCYKAAGKERHKLYAMFNIARNKMNMQEYRTADSILRFVERESINDSVLHYNCVYNWISCLVYMNEKDSATSLLNRNIEILDIAPSDCGYQEIIALYYNAVGDYAKSESYLDRVRSGNLTESDSVYYYYVCHLLAGSKGQTEESLRYFQKFTSIQNENLRLILSQPILGIQKEQYRIMAENELLKYRHARLTLILCFVIFLLIIVIVLVTYHYKKKRMKEQLYDSLAVVEELSGKIEDLKNQVRVQFHERHDLSNRLYSMYFDSESQDKITKQQLNVTINSLIKDYTAQDSVRKLDRLLNESYDGIMDRLSDPEIGLTDKEIELFRYSFAGLSSKSVSVIIKESPQNIYQIKSRLLKKVRRYSEDLWNILNVIW